MIRPRRQSPAEPALLVRLVGAFSVCRQGRTLAPAEVGDRGTRRLLALLAVQASRTVAVDRIVDGLWSAANTSPRDPAANIATLVSRLRRGFGAEVVNGDRRNGYRLGGQVRVDLQEAADLVRAAEALLTGRQPGQALAVARRALDALEGASVLIDEPAADWAEPARRRQEQLLRQVRHVAGWAALATGEATSAIGTGQAATTADPFDETGHRLLMCAYYLCHEPAHALATYERLRAVLAEEFGTDPARATRDLQVAILRHEALTPDIMVDLLRPVAAGAA